MPLSHERERALVVAAVAGAVDSCWPVRDGLGGIDWGWILRRLDELALGARFWSEAARAGVVEAIPPAARERLERRAHETAARSALLGAAALRAGTLLDAAGVRWMPMKGAALAMVLPGYAAMRHALDVDLVVPADDLERAARALAASVPLVLDRRDYDGAARDADAAMRDGVQHLHVFRGREGVHIELHHAFPGLTSREVTEAIFARAVPVEARGQRVLVPAKDDLLGTACVHAHVTHADDRAVALRHLADVAELLASGAAPDVASARYDRAGGFAVARSLRDLREASGDARVRGGPPSAASLAVDPGASGRVRGWVRRVAGSGLRMVEGVRSHGLDAVLPPRSFMVGRYGPAAAGRLLPLLHLRRWGGILLRAIKGP